MVATFLVNNSDFADYTTITFRSGCNDEINATRHSPTLTIISIPSEHTTITTSLSNQSTIRCSDLYISIVSNV